MGKQINYYMSEEDERWFVEFVISERDVGILMSRQLLPEPELCKDLPARETLGWFQLFLWDRQNSMPPKYDYVPQQRHYVLDRFESEVIEFHRSIMDEGRLVRGRLWVEMNGWRHDDPATIIKKSVAIGKWYEKLASWIKKRSKRNAAGAYVMPGAAAFAAQGGQLCQAVLASGKAL
jgi:hypothetical protein